MYFEKTASGPFLSGSYLAAYKCVPAISLYHSFVAIVMDLPA